MVFKTPVFWQHVANLSIFVAHFGIFVAHFGILKAKFEIERWKHHHFLALCCENFGIKTFMKFNYENTINILAFWNINFGVWALWNWPQAETRISLYLRGTFRMKNSATVGIWNPDFLKIGFQMVQFSMGWPVALTIAMVYTIWKPDKS